jgi:ABC-2 type transport system permease protein
MTGFVAFWKKEWVEQARSGRLFLLTVLFVAFGVMNPGIAKLTPLLLEAMAEDLAASGMAVGSVTVDAMASWTQFFKNLPIALILFVLLQSGTFTKEYQSGTLVLALTKGLSRHTVVLAKTSVLVLLWTVYYGLYFAVTYAGTVIFWDNGAAQSLPFASLCYWLMGLWVVLLTVLFSTVFSSSIGVLAGTGGTFFLLYLPALLPKIGRVLPVKLADGMSLLSGAVEASDYGVAVAVTAVLCVACLVASFPLFDRRRL